MKRREFIALAGGAVATWPIVARAQQPAIPVIGILGSATADGLASRTAAFLRGLKDAGFVEGQNVTIEYRWADDRYDQLPALAADLVRRRVSLIAAIGNNLPALAAKAATTTIPIVFAMGADPVQIGLVDSISRPGKNVTGVTGLAGDIAPKRLQLLHDLVPSAKVFGLLRNPDNNPSPPQSSPVQDTVAIWGGTMHSADARTVADFDVAFASLAEKRIEALVIAPNTLFQSGSERLVALAAQYAIPTAYTQLDAMKSGGLMSYSADPQTRQAGIYAGRILRGAKPADLPVLLPTKFVFGVNLGTAKTLGLTINPGLLAIADEVIE